MMKPHVKHIGKTFLVIFNSLAQFGYTVYYRVMAANEYGNLPQIRRRIYITAIHECIDTKYVHPEPIKLTQKSTDIIRRHEKQNDIYYYHQKALYPYFEAHMKDKLAIYRPTDREVRWTKNQMCPTLTANMGTYPDRVPVVCDITANKAVIRQNNCLHCGNCAEICPVGAVEKI